MTKNLRLRLSPVRSFSSYGGKMRLGITLLFLNLMLACAQPLPLQSQTEVTPLSEAEISQQLSTLPDWTLQSNQLEREYVFADFLAAIAFVNRLVEPAETAGHHPDILIQYNRVTLRLTTHDAGGITQKDFDLAQIISALSVPETTSP